MSDSDVTTVWKAWLLRQKRPGVCRFTDDRKKLIHRRLKLGYSVDDFIILVDYAYRADSPEARWWRGHNPDGRTYLDLSNLLVEEKLGGRITRALAWHEDQVRPRPVEMSSPEGLVTPGRAGSYRIAKRTSQKD